MNNLFAQSRSHWVRYDRYEIKTGKTGKRYITPEKTAKPDIYNPLKESSEMVLEALNVGMLMMNRSPEDAVEKAILTFVTHYGLYGGNGRRQGQGGRSKPAVRAAEGSVGCQSRCASAGVSEGRGSPVAGW